MKMNIRNLWMLAPLTVLVIGVVLISGCIDGPGEGPSGGPTSEWCPTGTYYDSPQGRGRVTGIEKYTFNGKTADLCCTEVSVGEQAEVKVCFSRDEAYGVIFNKEKGVWIKSVETYPKGDKVCTRMFDKEGEVTYEGCG